MNAAQISALHCTALQSCVCAADDSALMWHCNHIVTTRTQHTHARTLWECLLQSLPVRRHGNSTLDSCTCFRRWHSHKRSSNTRQLCLLGLLACCALGLWPFSRGVRCCCCLLALHRALLRRYAERWQPPLHLDVVCEVVRLPMQITELTALCVGHSVCVAQAGGFDKLDTCTTSSYVDRAHVGWPTHTPHGNKCFQQIPAGAQSL